MSGRRKPSRRPYASKYRPKGSRQRPVGIMGGGQGGLVGGPSAGGLQ